MEDRPYLHRYSLRLDWTGNLGAGTSAYRAYSRDHEVSAVGKPPIAGSSDPQFRGDAGRWNPEELLVASLSQCHMLWYLHLAAEAGVVVTGYFDEPVGTMVEEDGGSGRFTEVILRPRVAVSEPAMGPTAQGLHSRAAELCFISRSVNFPVHHEPVVG